MRVGKETQRTWNETQLAAVEGAGQIFAVPGSWVVRGSDNWFELASSSLMEDKHHSIMLTLYVIHNLSDKSTFHVVSYEIIFTKKCVTKRTTPVCISVRGREWSQHLHCGHMDIKPDTQFFRIMLISWYRLNMQSPYQCLYFEMLHMSWQHGIPRNGSGIHGCRNLTSILCILIFVLHISSSGTPNCHPLRKQQQKTLFLNRRILFCAISCWLKLLTTQVPSKSSERRTISVTWSL